MAWENDAECSYIGFLVHRNADRTTLNEKYIFSVKILSKSNRITPAIFLPKFTTDPQIFASVLIDWASISAEMSRGGDSFSSQSESNCDRGWRPLYPLYSHPRLLCASLYHPARKSEGCRETGRVAAGGRRGAPARGVPLQSSARTVPGCTSRPDGIKPHTYLRVAIKIEPELTAPIGGTVKKCFRNDRLINNTVFEQVLSYNRCFESTPW